MCFLVIITIAGLSLQFYISFRNFQTSQVQDSIQIQAEKAAASFETTLETWKTVIAANIANFRDKDKFFEESKIKNFLDSNEEFVHLEIYSGESKKDKKLKSIIGVSTTNLADSRFEDQDPANVIKNIQKNQLVWFSERVSQMDKTNVKVGNASAYTKLPMIYLAIRFDVEKSQKVLWVIVSAWQTNLIKVLPKSKTVDSYVVDQSGRIFSSPILKLMNRREPVEPYLANFLKKHESQPSGFIEEFKNSTDRRRVGSYARLPKFGTTILIEQDLESAYEETFRNLINTGLWAVLFILIAIMMAFVGSSSITKGLREVTLATIKIASGDFNYRIFPKTSDEVGALGHSINNMSDRIIQLMQAQVAQVRYEQELETAKMVQSTFFPKKDIQSPFTNITGFYTPASECGGDLWGHFRIDDYREFVFVADAMGHGAPAALVTAMAYSVVMTISDILKDVRSNQVIEPYQVLEKINNIIYYAVEGTISMTAFVMMFDHQKGIVTYANAGHNFPLIVPLSPEDARFPKSKAQSKKFSRNATQIQAVGTLLGISANSQYKQATMEIVVGDKLVLYTDGLIECRSPQGQQWGRKNLTECLLKNIDLEAKLLKDKIVQTAFEFYKKNPLADDITVVVVDIVASAKDITLPNTLAQHSDESLQQAPAYERKLPQHNMPKVPEDQTPPARADQQQHSALSKLKSLRRNVS